MSDTLPFAPPASSTCTLYLGDCLEVMPTLEPGNVAMVFADLPYGILTTQDWDRPLDLTAFWKALGNVRQKGSAILFMCNMRLAVSLIASNTREFRYDLVWQKKYTSNFMLAKKRPLNYHEHLLVYYQRVGTYNPQMLDERIEHGRTRTRGKAGKLYGEGVRIADRSGPVYPRSVIQNQNHHNRQEQVHPTQKPVALLEWLVKTYTNLGDTVLDPVMGSGTTGVACARLSRHFVGIEKDLTYFEIAAKRITEERANLGLTPPVLIRP